MKIDELIEEISDLKQAKELLQIVWNDIGPYNKQQVSKQTLKALNKYFKFDDSQEEYSKKFR